MILIKRISEFFHSQSPDLLAWATFFLVWPLAFSPWPLGLARHDPAVKIFVLIIFFVVVYGLRLWQSIRAGSFVWPRGHFNHLVAIFSLVWAASAFLLALDKHSAFYGQGDQSAWPVAYLLALTGLFFLIQKYREPEEKSLLLVSISISVAILVFLALLLASGYVPTSAHTEWLFRIVGGREQAAFWAAMFYGGFTAALFFKVLPTWRSSTVLLKILYGAYLSSMAVLTVSMFPPATVLAVLSAALALIFTIIGRPKDWWRSLPKALLMVSAATLILPMSMLALQISVSGFWPVSERYLAAGPSRNLTLSSVQARSWLGQGPENFSTFWSAQRPSEFNADEYWNIRYARPVSGLSYVLISGGLLSAGLLLACFLISLYLMYKVRSSLDSKERGVGSVLAVLAASATLAALIFPPEPITIALAYLLSGLALAGHLPFGSLRAASGVRGHFFQSLVAISVLAVLALIIFAFLLLRQSLAQVYFVRSLSVGEAEQTKWLERANDYDPLRVRHQARRAEVMGREAIAILRDEGRRDEAPLAIRRVLSAASTLAERWPWSVLAHETAAKVFRDLSSVAADETVAASAYQSFRRAIELEPSNPVLRFEYGSFLYKQKRYGDALSELSEVRRMRPDFAEASYYYALAEARLGKEQEALKIFQELEKDYQDPELFFEKGRIYFNAGDMPRAAESFRSSVSLSPLYADSLFGLALVLEKQEKYAESLAYLRKIKDLEPQNAEVLAKIKAVEAKEKTKK